MQTILCFGDSNTYGLIPGTADRYNEYTRFPAILKSELSDFKVFEDGIPGRTTTFSDPREGKVGIEFIESSIIKASPDLIIVMLGTNDLKKTNGTSEYLLEKSMNEFLSKLNNTKKANAKVLLISPVHLGEKIELTDSDFNYNSYLLSYKLDSIYEKLANKYGYYFMNSNSYANVGIDNEHFTIKSHINLAKALKNFILSI